MAVLATVTRQRTTLTSGHTADHAVLLGYGVPKCLAKHFCRMGHLTQIANAFFSQLSNFPFSEESTGPQNASGSSSAHAMRTAALEALVFIGSHGLGAKVVAVTVGCSVDAQHLLLERLDGRAFDDRMFKHSAATVA